MWIPFRGQRALRGILVWAAVSLLLLRGVVVDVLAHSPHDVIDAVAVSPDYAEDRTVFIVIGNYLMRSRDGGYSWKALINGLDNRHPLSDVEVSAGFGQDGTVFAAAGADGVYRSVNAGNSWTRADAGLDGASIESMVLSPRFDESFTMLAVASDGTVFRSEDAGQLWTPVDALQARVTAVRYADSKAPRTIIAGDDQGGVWVSRDDGLTWELRGELPAEWGGVTALAVSGRPVGGLTIVAGTAGGMVFRQDGEHAQFIALADLAEADMQRWRNGGEAITALALSPRYVLDGVILAAGWNEALMRSEDRGTTWERFDRGLSTDPQANTRTYFSPQFSDIALSRTFASDGVAFLAGFDGLFRSQDGGKTWTQMETLPLHLIKGLATAPGSGRETAIALSTYGGGGYVSLDSGKSWTIGTEGLIRTRLDGIAFSPEFVDDRTLFAGARHALLKTTNAGASWVPHEPGYSWRLNISRRLDHWGLETLGQWILQPHERGERPYPTDVVLSPAYGRDLTVFFGTRRHGIWVSRDGGATTEQVLDTGGVISRSVAISPAYERDGTVFAALRGGEIYRSKDRGLTWKPIGRIGQWDQGGAGTSHDDVIVDVFLEISPGYQRDRTLFAIGPFGMVKSADAGATWSTVTVLPDDPVRQVTGLGVSPAYETEPLLLVAVRGRSLQLSRDGGTSFRPVLQSLLRQNHAIEHVAFSPRFEQDHTAFVASEEALFRVNLQTLDWMQIPRPARYESHRDVLRYSGEWERIWENGAFRERVSREPGASVSLSFVGRGIVWRGSHGPEGGTARVMIDDIDRGVVSQHSAEREKLRQTFLADDLASGAHTITVEVLGDPRDGAVSIDAFDVFDPPSTADSAGP